MAQNKLNIEEQQWYDRLVNMGMSSIDANRLARIKVALDGQDNPKIHTWEDFVNLCKKSRRFSDSELMEMTYEYKRSFNDTYFPSSNFDNILNNIWNYIKNIFKK